MHRSTRKRIILEDEDENSDGPSSKPHPSKDIVEIIDSDGEDHEWNPESMVSIMQGKSPSSMDFWPKGVIQRDPIVKGEQIDIDSDSDSKKYLVEFTNLDGKSTKELWLKEAFMLQHWPNSISSFEVSSTRTLRNRTISPQTISSSQRVSPTINTNRVIGVSSDDETDACTSHEKPTPILKTYDTCKTNGTEERVASRNLRSSSRLANTNSSTQRRQETLKKFSERREKLRKGGLLSLSDSEGDNNADEDYEDNIEEEEDDDDDDDVYALPNSSTKHKQNDINTRISSPPSRTTNSKKRSFSSPLYIPHSNNSAHKRPYSTSKSKSSSSSLKRSSPFILDYKDNEEIPYDEDEHLSDFIVDDDEEEEEDDGRGEEREQEEESDGEVELNFDTSSKAIHINSKKKKKETMTSSNVGSPEEKPLKKRRIIDDDDDESEFQKNPKNSSKDGSNGKEIEINDEEEDLFVASTSSSSRQRKGSNKLRRRLVDSDDDDDDIGHKDDGREDDDDNDDGGDNDDEEEEEEVLDGPALYHRVNAMFDDQEDEDLNMSSLGLRKGLPIKEAMSLYLEMMGRTHLEKDFAKKLAASGSTLHRDRKVGKYLEASRQLENLIGTIRESLLASGAWNKEFFAELSTRPFYATMHIPSRSRSGYDDDEECRCQACNRRLQGADHQVYFFGTPYPAMEVWNTCRWAQLMPQAIFLHHNHEDDESNEDDEEVIVLSEDSEDELANINKGDDEDEDDELERRLQKMKKKNGSGRKWWLEGWPRELTKAKESKFNLAGHCKSRSLFYHTLLHYKFRLLLKVRDKLENGHQTLNELIQNDAFVDFEVSRFQKLLAKAGFRYGSEEFSRNDNDRNNNQRESAVLLNWLRTT